MGDLTKFRYIWEYYAFHAAVVLLLLVELFIFIYTIRRNSCTQAAPVLLRQMMFSPFVADIGIIFILAGIVIRLCAVLTLKKAFTLHVQTSAGQHLVTSGLYHVIRHPAYSGSVLSLFGVALALRNIVAVCLVLFGCLICYGMRIRVEEKALQAQFGKEYADYKRSTYKLLPYIF